jgi:hypothetical protein
MLDANTIAVLGQFGISAASAEAALSAMAVLTAVTVIAAIPTAILARRKGRSFAFWMVLGLSIPVLPLLLVWLLPKQPERPSA